MGKINVAVVGCSHGELDKIYETIQYAQQDRGEPVQLVVCCGDFQSVRNMTDLRCMACPIKYQHMQDFHRYYSGEKKAPVLTIFIGGNHEASNYLQELPFGGWVAPNIFYLGFAGVIRYGPLRIAGLSGIYKGQDYLKGRYETPPYNPNSMRSVYHYRNVDIFRLKQIKTPVDIMLSHDWPKGIHNYGDVERLLRQKPFFRDEVYSNTLGSRPLFEILTQMRPKFWFSAHLHVKFEATVIHPPEPQQQQEKDQQSSDNCGGNLSQEPKCTRFLALDKVLPRRQFLQIVEFPVSDDLSQDDYKLSYDPEWLAILKSTDDLVSVSPKTTYMPGPGYNSGRTNFIPTDKEVEEVVKLFEEQLTVSDNFVQTAQCHVPNERPENAIPNFNPQTTELCQKLLISDPLRKLVQAPSPSSRSIPAPSPSKQYQDPSQLNITMNNTYNPDEISLDDDEEDPPPVPSPRNAFATSLKSPHYSPSPFRSKLNLPPPKDSSSPVSSVSGSKSVEETSTSSSSTVTSQNELSVFESIFGKSEGDESNGRPQSLEEAGHYFVLDKGGEPNLKKRRNELMYNEGEDNDSE